jgi:hypothetical protein
MNSSSKNKLLTWLVVILLLANAATLITFWVARRQHPPPFKGTAADFLIKELNLDSAQQKNYLGLINEHRLAVEQLRDQLKKAKDNFFDLLKQPNTPDSIKIAYAKNISQYTEKIDLLTIDHFNKVRNICRPGQQVKFDSIIQQVVQMMGPPKPPPPGNRPPPPDQMPPPSQ